MPYSEKEMCLVVNESRAKRENMSRKVMSNVLDLFIRDQRWKKVGR